MKYEVKTLADPILKNLESENYDVVAKALSDLRQISVLKRRHGDPENSCPDTSHFKESPAANALLRKIIPQLTTIATAERFSENISTAEEILVDIGKRAIPELTRATRASDWRLSHCLRLLRDISERWELDEESLGRVRDFAEPMCLHRSFEVAQWAQQCSETINAALIDYRRSTE